MRFDLMPARGILREATWTVFSGCQIWAAVGGEVIWDEALGATAYDGHTDHHGRRVAPRPVDSETLFDLASVTKAIGTAVVAMRRYAHGALDLGGPIARDLGHLPLAPYLRGASWADLLAHRTRLPAYARLFAAFDAADPPLPAQARTALAARIAALPARPASAPTSEYSDFGYILLGWALERATGLPLDALWEAEVAAPLGLQGQLRTFSADEAAGDAAAPIIAATERCAWRGGTLSGEVHDEHAWLLGGHAGHAGLFGTARAVGAVGDDLLAAATGRGGRLAPGAVVRRFWDPGERRDGSRFCLGFDGAEPTGSSAGPDADDRTVGHLGYSGCSLWIYPDRELVVALCTNRVHPSRENKAIGPLRRAVHGAITAALTSPQPSLF